MDQLSDITPTEGGVVALVCVSSVVSMWAWIACRRGSNASSWNSVTARPGALVYHLSASFERHLRGRNLWVGILIGAVLLLLVAILVKAGSHFLEFTFSYACAWVTGWTVLLVAWCRVGQGGRPAENSPAVSPGLLANFFIFGGCLGAAFAMVYNSLLIESWQAASPVCNPMNIGMTLGCNAEAALMWVFTPGLVEESFKSVWLFFRLRRSLEDLPTQCCFCLPAFRSYDCGCWYKLAPTPYHVLLCALASGAGFESMENLLYIFRQSAVLQSVDSEHVQKMLQTAVARALTSGMHMVWTSLIGLGLARRLFLPQARRPSLPAVLLPSMLAHGLFDYSITAFATRLGVQPGEPGQQPPSDATIDLVSLLFLLLGFSIIIGSVLNLARLTGCRGPCFCGATCCCAPGFWEKRYGANEEQSRELSLVGPPASVQAEVVEGLSRFLEGAAVAAEADTEQGLPPPRRQEMKETGAEQGSPSRGGA